MQTTHKIDFKRERDFSEKINGTFEFVRQNFSLLIKSLLLSVVPMLVTGMVAGLIFMRLTGARQNEGIGLEGKLDQLVQRNELMMGSTFYGLLVFVVLTAVVYSHIQLYIQRPLNGFTAGEVIRNALKNLGRILATTVGAVFVLVVIVGGFLMLIAKMQAEVLRWLVIPVFCYLAVVISMMPAVATMERIGFFKTTARTLQLLNGNWWVTFALLAIVILIQFLMMLGIAMPFSTYSALIPFLSQKGMESSAVNIFYMLLTAVYSIGALILYMVPLVAMSFQYFSLLEQKEAPGLIERIALIGIPPEEEEDF